MALIDLANPTRFLALVNRLLPWLAGATAVLFVLGLYRAMGAPDDYQQGATVKIMFLHVPSAWLGMFGWGVMSVAALGTLVWRHPLADVAGKAAAPLGAAGPEVVTASFYNFAPSFVGRAVPGVWELISPDEALRVRSAGAVAALRELLAGRDAEVKAAAGLLDRALTQRASGPYQVQAAIAALHAEAPDYEHTDWRQIRLLYSRLQQLAPSPVVLLNRAVATRYAMGAEQALAEIEPLSADLDRSRARAAEFLGHQQAGHAQVGGQRMPNGGKVIRRGAVGAHHRFRRALLGEQAAHAVPQCFFGVGVQQIAHLSRSL